MNTMMDDSTSSSELELPEVEPRFIPFTSTPLDAKTDKVDDSRRDRRIRDRPDLTILVKIRE